MNDEIQGRLVEGLLALSEADAVDYDPPLRYLARVFLRDAAGTPGATAVSSVRSALQLEADLQLGVLQQVQIDTGMIRNGIGLYSKDGIWTVSITAESIDITCNTPLAGPSLPYFDFVSRCKAAFVALMSPSDMKGTRIACVSEGLLPEMRSETLDAIAQRLLKYPPTFAPAPWEWDWRCVSSCQRVFGSSTENTNTVAAVRRLTGQFAHSGAAFDRIRLDIDINTHASDTTARFGHAEVAAFFDAYPSWYTEIKQEIIQFITKDAQ